MVGNSQVIWTLTDEAGNKAQCIQEVRITASNKDIKPNAGEDATVCEGNNVPLNSSSIGKYTKLSWSTSGSGTFSDLSALHPTYQPSAADILNKQVILTLTGYTECANASDHMILTISPYPKLSAGSDFSVCYGETVSVSQAMAVNISTLVWSTTGQGMMTGSSTIKPVYQPAPGEKGIIRFVMTGTGAGGCSGVVLKDTMQVLIHDPLVVEASDDITILKDMTTVLSATVSGGSGSYDYRWEPTDQVFSYNTNQTMTDRLLSSTTFIITVTDSKWGCSARDTVQVTVRESIDDLLIIYNAISPNNDGLNDIWYIDGIELFPENEVMIFNRWGDKIKEFKGYDNTGVFWDGTNTHGKRVPDGTYYYVLKIKDLKTYTGWIQVKSSL